MINRAPTSSKPIVPFRAPIIAPVVAKATIGTSHPEGVERPHGGGDVDTRGDQRDRESPEQGQRQGDGARRAVRDR
jgi:hypothetical protein